MVLKSRELRYQEHVARLKALLKPGVFYEDCRYHPMVCIGVNWKKGFLVGISLVDGKVGNCSCRYCGVRILTPQEALRNRLYGVSSKVLEGYEGFESKWRPKGYRKSQEEYGIFFPRENAKDVEWKQSRVGKRLRRKR